jgi:hypothetical protein
LVKTITDFSMPLATIVQAEDVLSLMLNDLAMLVSHDIAPNVSGVTRAMLVNSLSGSRSGLIRSTTVGAAGHSVVFVDLLTQRAAQVALYTRCVTPSPDFRVDSVDPLNLYAAGDFLYGRGAGGHKGLLAMTFGAVAALVKSGRCPCNLALIIDGSNEPVAERQRDLAPYLYLSTPDTPILILEDLFARERQIHSLTGVRDLLPTLSPVAREMPASARPDASRAFRQSYEEVLEAFDSKLQGHSESSAPLPALPAGAAQHLNDRTSRAGLVLGAAIIMRMLARVALMTTHDRP